MAATGDNDSVKEKNNTMSRVSPSAENPPNGNVKQNWSHEMLTKLQESAVPVPIRVACTATPPAKPDYLGVEYHGRLSKGDDKKLLLGKSGRFIIRDTHGPARENEYTIVFNYAGDIQSIKLVYNPDNKTFKTDPTSNKKYKSVLLLMDEVLTLYHNLEKRQAGSARSSPAKKTSNYQKSHNFNLHTYLFPKWCDHCKEFLWGIHNQGYRCDDCNLTVHKFCKDIIDLPCSKLEYGTKISVVEGSKNDSEEVDINSTAKVKRGSIPDFHNKCQYFRDCSRFLSAYNIRDIYIDMTHTSTRCFCSTCNDGHVLCSDNKITSECFPNWTYHLFKGQDDPLKRNVNNWEIAYFPIKPKYVLKMITECFEPPDDDSDIDLIIAKNFEHTILDMDNENYSHRYINSQTGDYSYAQIVFEIYVKPSCYQTVSLANNDPHFVDKCDIRRNHFKVKKRKFIYPKSLLIKIFRDEDANVGETSSQ